MCEKGFLIIGSDTFRNKKMDIDLTIPYKKLVETIGNKPIAYETTGIPFWDDENISKSMLALHLNPDVESASRTHEFMDRSVDWIVSLLGKQDGRILDLGCGPGMYAKRFADKGFSITGIDFSQRSIAYASENYGSEKSEFIYQDYLTIDYDKDFDLTILIYCDFGVLSPENRVALLKKIYRGLKPGGLFVVDVHTSYQYKEFTDSLTVENKNGGFWRADSYINIKRKASYPNQNYLEQYTIITAEDCATYNIWNHGFEPKELEETLLNAGFASVVLYGDVVGANITDESPIVCAVCRK